MYQDTIGKMVTVTAAGLFVSLTDIEMVFRIGSLAITTFLSIRVYLKDQQRKKNEKED